MGKTIHICSKCEKAGNWIFSGEKELTHIPCKTKEGIDG